MEDTKHKQQKQTNSEDNEVENSKYETLWQYGGFKAK